MQRNTCLAMPAVQETRKEKIPILGRNSCFPLKVYQLLQYASTNNLENIIHWTVDGNGFHVLNSDEFMKQVAPSFFPNQKSFRSFERMLNIWGFIRQRCTPIKSLWSNPNFVRDRPDLCRYMRRIENKGTKKRVATGPNSYVFVKTKVPISVQQQQQAALKFITRDKAKKVEAHRNGIQDKHRTKQVALDDIQGEDNILSSNTCQQSEDPRLLEPQSPKDVELKSQVGSGKDEDTLQPETRSRSSYIQDGDNRLMEPQEKLRRWLWLRGCKVVSEVGRKPSTCQQDDDKQMSRSCERLQRWLQTRAIEPARKRGNIVLHASSSGPHQEETAKKRLPTFAQRRKLPTKARSKRLDLQKLVTYKKRTSRLSCNHEAESEADSLISNEMLSMGKASALWISPPWDKMSVCQRDFERILQSTATSQEVVHVEGQFDDAPESHLLRVLADVAISDSDKK